MENGVEDRSQLGGVQSFVSTTGHVDAGLLMAGHAGEDDPVEGGVGLTITSPVQPVSSFSASEAG